ncbi:MAG: L-serine ammonia-lyase [Cardiobacteriaceae bacterium]|nr:L-serine ammonia-lyase [Cardiobacteriaceae bacterium]
MISIFDMFKVGIGPSSSHTVAPMRAGVHFRKALQERGLWEQVERYQAEVYGSLSLTGKGHNTDGAIIGGLAGFEPDTVDTTTLPDFIERMKVEKQIEDIEGRRMAFDYAHDFIFHRDFLPLHENGMRLKALCGEEVLHSQVYYSIGGGFIVTEEDFAQLHEEAKPLDVPYPYQHASDLLHHAEQSALPLSAIMFANEKALRSEGEIRAHVMRVWETMKACIARGLETEGVLPGRLKIVRRAPQVKKRLEAQFSDDPMQVMDWVNMIAFAVNEENAAGGRVVTAPTNGACGIVPAVLAYYERFVQPLNESQIMRYFLVAGLIGSLYKMNASISGAEVGCQGETGVACSMAAAGLAELQGATPEQVCNAAEIAMEHHLGLTCDPIGGQVQVPCIERNAVSSIKAINAARMALLRSGKTVVSLDDVIKTMFETGKDMDRKYRETSIGGLAKQVPC